MTQPLEIFNDEIRTVLLLVVAFLRDNVSQYIFGCHTAEYDALDHLAFSSRLSEQLVAEVISGELELVAPTNAFRSDKEIVHPNDGDGRVRGSRSVLLSSSSTADAEPAPRSKRIVVNAVSLDFSFIRW